MSTRIHPAADNPKSGRPLLLQEDRNNLLNDHVTAGGGDDQLDNATGSSHDDHVNPVMISTDDDVAPTAVPSVPLVMRRIRPTVLTVWKRSSMSFQGTDGFTVFDGHGQLAFRVDNYSRKIISWSQYLTTTSSSCSSSCAAAAPGGSTRDHVRAPSSALVLMDGSGKPLLTLIPPHQIFSMQHQWSAYRGGEEEDNECGSKTIISRRTSNRKSLSSVSSPNILFTMRRPISTSVLLLLGSRHRRQHRRGRCCEAEVFMGNNDIGAAAATAGLTTPSQSRFPDFRIEGSFWRRNCKIKDNTTGDVAAKIVRKRAPAAPKMSSSSTAAAIMLSDDVFSLVVQPPFDPQLMMAFVVILDRICIKPSAPLLCS